MEYHRLLKNQIEKFIPGIHQNDECFALFLESVNNAYISMEQDKQMAEHVFSISEREYQEVLDNLKIENNIKIQSINKLKDAIRSLDTGDVVFIDDDNDIISIINYLEKQISKSKSLEQELINSKDIAEHALKAKSEFLSVMSHEIRTPLNAIIGNIHLLQQQEILPEQETFLKSLHISADNLLSLINDILDFGKMEEGKIQFAEKEFNLKQLIANVKNSNFNRAAERENEIRILVDDKLPDLVVGDEVRLAQILNNLLTNAIKFTKNGITSIEVKLVDQDAEYIKVYFSVSDTGIGIKKEQQAMIFERFTQANSNITRQYGGSGLGLTIVKRLLQLQNSDINLESEFGQGSHFYFTLTLKVSKLTNQEDIENTIPTMKNLCGIRVLLVEDFIFNVMVAEKMLQNWNAVVDLAENGQIAVDKVRVNEYDVILMDLQMPVMDGLTATKTIRTFNTNVPIIALTASASAEIQASVIAIGMNDYLSKPFNPDELYRTIYKHAIKRR